MTTPSVLVETLAAGQYRLGVLTLDRPRSLNALSLDMIGHVAPALDRWERDPQCVAVVLQGSGDKAFCAGGDIVGVYQALQTEQGLSLCDQLFTEEYRLDYRIHTYSKPVLAWGGGLVMGGGMGLLVGASHRVVTETTRMAMPEISIGLFPDVGASWFLNRMPGRVGLFLGLTGAPFNAADAVALNLADAVLPQSSRQSVIEGLAGLPWSHDTEANRLLLSRYLYSFAQNAESVMEGLVLPRFASIQHLTRGHQLAEVVRQIEGYHGMDSWLSGAVDNLKRGSPLSAALTWNALQRARHYSLAEVFAQDLNLARQCCRQGEFQEGIRALLIDKDRQPRWRYPNVAAVPEAIIAQHFLPPQSES